MPTNVFKTQKARHRGKPTYRYAEGRSTQGDVVVETAPSALFVRGDVVMDRRSDQMGNVRFHSSGLPSMMFAFQSGFPDCITKTEKAESEAQRGKPKGTLESESRNAIL